VNERIDFEGDVIVELDEASARARFSVSPPTA
jgi:hypothetical protein